MQIGDLSIDSPFILAPLAGYTDLPFRLLCREYGAGLCYSEMISCHGLVYQQQNTLDMIRSDPAERPVAMQLFGGEPEIMGEAAAILSKHPIDIIDINMGCPVRKVIKKGAGAALLKDSKRAEEIIRAVCAHASMPVTVKTRIGWNHHMVIAEEFALMAQEAGASAVIIHGRTWSDGFSGQVDWPTIARVKEALTVPVIGNGDLHCHEDGRAMMAETGCDGVMIGRAALGAPWIFSEKINPAPSLVFRKKALLRHLELVTQHSTAKQSTGAIKNHAGKYFREVPGGSAIRQRIYETRDIAELIALIEDLGR